MNKVISCAHTFMILSISIIGLPIRSPDSILFLTYFILDMTNVLVIGTAVIGHIEKKFRFCKGGLAFLQGDRTFWCGHFALKIATSTNRVTFIAMATTGFFSQNIYSAN